MLCGGGTLGVDLMQLVIAPTVAYKLNAEHSVGAAGLDLVCLLHQAQHRRVPRERPLERVDLLVDDGGVAESVSKSIPIVMKRLQASFFPEGGKLVVGLESRVYVEAKNLIGKPADIEGKIVDDQGNVAATFSTYKAGLGRFMLRPAP